MANLDVMQMQNNSQLTNVTQLLVIERPTLVPLKFKGHKYYSKSVSCGATFTFVIGLNNSSKHIMFDQDEQDILNALREIILQQKTLAYFFDLTQQSKHDPQSRQEEYLRTEELDTLQVSRSHFIECIEKAKMTIKKGKIQSIADKILEDVSSQSNGGIADKMNLSDIEDLALGYKADQSKVFAFGQGHKNIFAFQRKHMDEEDALIEMGGVQKQFQNEIIVITRPTAIRFPRHTRPIIAVSCGSAHILAVTDSNQLFSWGCGQYGALGFGMRDDVTQPTLLHIFNEDILQEVSQIACGKYHSLCLTKKSFVYSWGTGQSGRLGHGDEEDNLIPREVTGMVRGRPISIAAGESHSACITDRLSLYTWGSGQFGRLGHGFDTNEKRPKFVEDLDNQEIVQVSCGAFHTLAVGSQGTMYAFGQGKYGKLGLNRKEREGVFIVPQRAYLYKIDQTGQGDNRLVQDKNEAVFVVASYNHSLALSKSGKVYSWGFSGKGVLGRPRKIEEHLPLEIGLKQNEFVARVYQYIDDYIKGGVIMAAVNNGDAKHEQQAVSFEVSQVSSGSLNTAVLTNGGEVYVIGSNTFGQLGREQVRDPLDKTDEAWNQISLIRFPGGLQKRIAQVSCGGEHIFALSRNNELYGWGRNDDGELGIGYISEYVSEPQLIKDLASKNVTFVACGEDYTAVLSVAGEIFVTGSMENGKLGLGQAQSSGVLLNFTMIPNLHGVKFVACGPNHMLALTESHSDPTDKRGGSSTSATYAWGLNSRGQLGIGNKEDQKEPVKIPNAKEKYKKVVCGQNFSMGLSVTNQVYFWGNYKYFCEKVNKDIEEPIILKSMDGKSIKDISCCKYQCLVLNDKGEILQWGKYLKDKIKNKMEGIKSASDVKSINKFPNTSKFDVLMESISTGPNHSASVSMKKSIYSWGFPEGGRLGLNKEDIRKARNEPVIVQNLMSLLQASRHNQKEDQIDEILDDYMNNINNQQIGDNPEKGLLQLSEAPSKNGKPLKQLMISKMLSDTQKQEEANHEQIKITGLKMMELEQHEESKGQQNENAQQMISEIFELPEIKSQPPKQKLNLISLTAGIIGNGQNIMSEAHSRLQKILKKERYEQHDEDSIIRFDEEIFEDIESLLSHFRKFLDIEHSRKDSKIQLQSSFLQRTIELPFKLEIDPSLRMKSIGQNVYTDKKRLKMILTTLHVHPCYLVRLYQAKLLENKEFVKVVKAIYSFPNDKSLYFVITIMQQVLKIKFKTAPDEFNMLNQNSVIGNLFKYSLKSQPANMDTLCSIGCHVIKYVIYEIHLFSSKLISKLSQNQSANQDSTFDVTEVLSKGQKLQPDSEKGNKSNLIPKRAIELMSFVEEIIRDIIDDDVLYPFAPFFQAKKLHIEDIEARKRNNKSMPGQIDSGDQHKKLETLRFSGEIAYLIETLYQGLKDNDNFERPLGEDFIISQILGVTFSYLSKIWRDFDLYLFPYVKSVKSLAIIEDVIKKTHKNNLDNVFHLLECFFKGEQPFPEYASEMWNRELTAKMNHLEQQSKSIILMRIMEKNQLKSLSFKNFENVLIHSLDGEGHQITIRKKQIGQVLQLFSENPQLSIHKPIQEDPLYCEILQLSETTVKQLQLDTRAMNFRLKSRLLMEDQHPIVTRCGECQSILTQKYAPPDSMTILEKYNPQDSQSLVSQYCAILKVIPELNKIQPIIEQLDKTYQTAKRHGDFELANMMLKFMNQVELEVQNTLNKTSHEGGGSHFHTGNQINHEQDEMKVKEGVFIEIQKQAEVKINERRTRKHDLAIIQHRLTQVLVKQIQHKVRFISEKEIPTFATTIQNLQYGFANHELKHLADAYALKHMRNIIDYTTGAKMSKTLFKNLGTEQKAGLKSIIKKQAAKLIKNKTITQILMPQFKPLIGKCEFVFLEGDDQSMNIKLLFRDQKFQFCGPPKILSEAILLNLTLSQKELLDMRKQGKTQATHDSQKVVFAGAIEFDHQKLIKIFNKMERSKAAYLLNSGSTTKNSKTILKNDNRV